MAEQSKHLRRGYAFHAAAAVAGHRRIYRADASRSNSQQIWKPGGTIFNLVIESQWTAFHHDGVGFLEWTIFIGLNMTFGK